MSLILRFSQLYKFESKLENLTIPINKINKDVSDSILSDFSPHSKYGPFIIKSHKSMGLIGGKPYSL